MTETEPLTQPAPEMPPPPAPPPAPPGTAGWGRRRFYRPAPGAGLGFLLVLLGIYFLLQNLGLLTWVNWDIVWPVVLILTGLWILVRRRR